MRVFLRDGTSLIVWCSSFSIQDGEYVFDTLVDADPAEQAELNVSARTPSNPRRILVVNARIAADLVDRVESV
jgi:hypothetical protein